MLHMIMSGLRRLCAAIDGVVVWVIETLYMLLIQIADTNVFGNLIYEYLGRIYTFLGIFMVFKLSLSIINYIVNPDALTDKSKGFSKLITNVVISLVLLAVTPNIFDMAFNLQSDILTNNVIYQIVTGHKMSNDGYTNNAKKNAQSLSYAVYSSFIYGYDNTGNIVAVSECERSKDPRCLLKSDIVTDSDGSVLGIIGGEFVYEYQIIISTVCGVFVAYMLLTFCIQTSVRAVKLGVLQIIAPIPILSMIDPKTGTSKLSKWGKESLNTFLDLFIRLAGLFFALDLIQSIIQGGNGMMTFYSNPKTEAGIFVKLFIILGCLIFAKQLPGLIDDLFGTKLSSSSGGFSLKKMVGSAVGGTALLAGGAMLGRASVGATRLGANTVNAGARLGLSTLKNKLTGKDNSASVDRFRQRMNYAGQEAKGRFTSLNKKYTGDNAGKLYKKNVSSEKEATKQFDKGNKLWEEVQKSGDEYSIYSNPSFRDSVKLMNDAKSRRNKATEAYDLAQIQFQRGEISQDEFSKIRLASIDAQSDFDKAKAEFDEQSKIHTSDAEKYKLYSATADRIKVERNVYSNNNMGSASSSSSSSVTASSTSNSNPTVEVMRAPKDMHANDDSYYNDMGM